MSVRPRPSRSGLSSLRLFVLGLVLAGSAILAWNQGLEAPVKAAVRDYLSPRIVEKYADVLLQASCESGVDRYLLAGLMIRESGGRMNAVSPKDALGLFQLSETTATWRSQELGLPLPTREELLSDALLNARLGADNLAWLLDTFDGDELRALCAYNAGARRMKEIADAQGGWEEWLTKRRADGSSSILAYAQGVLRNRDRFRERGLLELESGDPCAGGELDR